MVEVTPKQIKDAAAIIDKAADSALVQGIETVVVSKLSKKVRGAIYETGKWVGVAGAVVAIVAGALDGAPALYAAAAAAVLLSVNGFIAKAHLA